MYHGDCLEIMPQLEPVDLVLTDPPYGIGESNKRNLSRVKLAKPKDYKAAEWDEKPPPPEYFKMVQNLSTNQIIFGGNYFVKWLDNSPCWIVWDKDNTGDFADCELAWTSFDSAVRKIRWRWNGFLKEAPETRYHLTQKPVGLFLLILDKYAKENDTVLDTHFGSGTTALACERLNLKWIGIEISEEYCEIAAKRIENATRQLKLF